MLALAVVLLLSAPQQVTTAPSNITKVSRGEAICDATGTLSDLQAGVTYELVAFVDSGVRYTLLQVHFESAFGVHHYYGQVASDLAPLCPSGSRNAGMRPHLLPLRLLERGTYTVTVLAFNDPTMNGLSPRPGGVLIYQMLVTVR